MTVLAIAASTASAKMYYFKNFEADFARQPVVTKSATSKGHPYVSYDIDYDDGTFGFTEYGRTVSDMSAHQAHQINLATKIAGGDPLDVESHTGELNGHPVFALKYIHESKRGTPLLSLKCWVYTETHLYMVVLITKPENMVIADRYMARFMESLSFKAVAPEVRPAIPVTNDATEGEI